MPIVAFNSIPVTNETGCQLLLLPSPGCGNSLGPGGLTTLNCSSDAVYDLNTFTAYEWVSNRTFSPPSFGQFTVCNQTTVILTIYSPQTREAEEVEGTSVGKLELVRSSED
jgi:hypothetical protein